MAGRWPSSRDAPGLPGAFPASFSRYPACDPPAISPAIAAPPISPEGTPPKGTPPMPVRPAVRPLSEVAESPAAAADACGSNAGDCSVDCPARVAGGGLEVGGAKGGAARGPDGGGPGGGPGGASTVEVESAFAAGGGRDERMSLSSFANSSSSRIIWASCASARAREPRRAAKLSCSCRSRSTAAAKASSARLLAACVSVFGGSAAALSLRGGGRVGCVGTR